jgi:HEAT repeat protein
MPNPPLSDATLEQLIDRLGDSNLAVRTLATNELVDRVGEPAVAPLRGLLSARSSSPSQRAHGLWVLERLQALDDRLVGRLLDDPDRLVRVHIVKALAERPDWRKEKLDLPNLVRGKLADPDPFVRRAAAEALGRHRQLENLRPLVDLWSKTPPDDTHLVHVIRIALRDHLAVLGMYAALEQAKIPGADRALRAKLADVSLGLPTADAAGFILAYLDQQPDDVDRLPDYAHHAARNLPDDRLAALFRSIQKCRDLQGDLSLQRDLLQAVQHGLQERGGPALPSDLQAWAGEIAKRLLAERDADQATKGIEFARELNISGAVERLTAIASSADMAAARPAAIDACVALDGGRSVPLLSELIGRGRESLALRQKAAQALATIDSDPARRQLLLCLAAAPERLGVDIAAGLAATKPGGELVLATIGDG